MGGARGLIARRMWPANCLRKSDSSDHIKGPYFSRLLGLPFKVGSRWHTRSDLTFYSSDLRAKIMF